MKELEKNINLNKSILENIECVHTRFYKNSLENSKPFEFLPGHRLYLLNFAQSPAKTDTNQTFDHPAFSKLLQILFQTALKNYNNTSSKNNRYSEDLMDFAIYIYIMAGKACYEVISANLPMPSFKTIRNNTVICIKPTVILTRFVLSVFHIQRDKDRIVEGELRSEQLAKYLENIKSPKYVFLSEDASGVVQKVTYDVHSNQLVGLVLPFNNLNGMPKMFSFEAKNAEAIEQYLKLPQSTLVYIIVAQPLVIGAAPFILQIFGTNNTFETSDVLSRWKYTETELNK